MDGIWILRVFSIRVGIYNLLEMDIGFTCIASNFHSDFGFILLLASMFAVWATSHDTCASGYRCLLFVFSFFFLLRLGGQDRIWSCLSTFYLLSICFQLKPPHNTLASLV